MSELSDTKTFKVLDTLTLSKVNQHAIELNQNRSLVSEFFDNVDPEGTHVIGFHMDHVNFEGTAGVRCNIYCKMKGDITPVSVWIDVTHKEFLNFETVTVDSVTQEIKELSDGYEIVRPDGPETDRGGLIGQQPY